MTVAGPGVTVHGDWGSTHLRLFLMQGHTLLDRAVGPGIGTLTLAAADALRAALAPWRATYDVRAVLLCGMAGARNGLAEATYLDCPAGFVAWSREVSGLTSMARRSPSHRGLPA